MKDWNLSNIKVICADIKAVDSRGAIKELARMMKGWHEIEDFDKFVDDVLKREALQPTGMGDEVAIPHARSASIKKFVMVFGRSKTGIDFGAPDGKPARLIFLMGIPILQIRGYLQLVRNLSSALKKEQLRQALCDAGDKDQMLEIFKKESNGGESGFVSAATSDTVSHG